MIDAELRGLDLPPDEVDAVVTADNPVVVHRYLELHRERLQERLAKQLRTLERLERLLAPVIVEAASRPGGGQPSDEDGPSLYVRAGRSGDGGTTTCEPSAGTVGRRGLT